MKWGRVLFRNPKGIRLPSTFCWPTQAITWKVKDVQEIMPYQITHKCIKKKKKTCQHKNIPHINAIPNSAHCSPFTGNFCVIHQFVWDTAAELRNAVNSMITRKWKWYFVHGCKCESLTSNGTKFLDLCQDGTSALMYLGIMMENDTYMQQIEYI